MNSDVFDKHIQHIIDKFSEQATDNQEEMEKRKFGALKTKSIEAVFESFPQLLLQMYILLRSFSSLDTVEISQSNIKSLISICFSFLSLVKTALDLHEYDRNKHKITQPKSRLGYVCITSLWYFFIIMVKAMAQTLINTTSSFLLPGR